MEVWGITLTGWRQVIMDGWQELIVLPLAVSVVATCLVLGIVFTSRRVRRL